MQEGLMGLFNFGRDRGKDLKTPIRQGSEQTSAAEMADMLRDLGITIEGGRITVKGDEVTITGKASDTAEKERAVLILGNTKGVAKVNDQITVAAQAQAQSQFYGDSNKYSAIFEANKPMLKDPDEIYPGQTLRIPQQH
jgi:hypothetical protein